MFANFCREAAAKLNINREIVLRDILNRSGVVQDRPAINGAFKRLNSTIPPSFLDLHSIFLTWWLHGL